MGIHRLGGLPNFGTTPPVRRMPPARPEGEMAQTLAFPSDDAGQMPLPAPSIKTLAYPSDDGGQLPVIELKPPTPLPKAKIDKLDQAVEFAQAAAAADPTPEAKRALLIALLKASSGYRQVAPDSPKVPEFSRLAVDTATDLNWTPVKASEKERRDMKRAAQTTYANPASEEQRERALDVLRRIQVFDQGQTWRAPGAMQTMRWPSDDAGQAPNLGDGPSL